MTIIYIYIYIFFFARNKRKRHLGCKRLKELDKWNTLSLVIFYFWTKFNIWELKVFISMSSIILTYQNLHSDSIDVHACNRMIWYALYPNCCIVFFKSLFLWCGVEWATLCDLKIWAIITSQNYFLWPMSNQQCILP